MNKLGVRWTIGDVSDQGFEALRLSVQGAQALFGSRAKYVVCVNTISVAEAQKRASHVLGVEWYDASNDIPVFLREHFDQSMAEGVGWKLAPMRYFPDLYELSLDNDLVLWRIPEAIHTWLEQEGNKTCVVAEDVSACFGQFAQYCPDQPRNGGIRGLPPDFDLETRMREILEEHPVTLSSELDERGLQTAAIARSCVPLVVSTEEVSICSPWPPHVRELGSCGAHFCGLNARRFNWDYEGRNGAEYTAEHWRNLKPVVEQRVAAAAAVLL